MKILNGEVCKLNKLTIILLMNPILGLSNKIHEIVWRIPGIIRGINAIAVIRLLKGVLVRSTKKAKLVPRTRENRHVPMA